MNKLKYSLLSLGVILSVLFLAKVGKESATSTTSHVTQDIPPASTNRGKSDQFFSSLEGLELRKENNLNDRLTSASKISEEMFIAQLLEDIKYDEHGVISLLADEAWFKEQKLDPEIVGDALLRYYVKNDNIFQGLEAFETLHSNAQLCDLNLDKFAIVANEEDSVRAFNWTFKHAKYEGAPSALYELGNRFDNKIEAQANISKVLESDYSDYTKSAYIAGSIDKWVESDFEGALTYLSEIPPTPALDTIIYDLIDLISDNDPEVALLWGEQIQNEEMRLAAFRDIKNYQESNNYSEE